uniref:Uncharacterized protein n=1 Tax=Rhizophora mucronata TaxID=61149 RepID=A0A2P2NRL7_RHIMU
MYTFPYSTQFETKKLDIQNPETRLYCQPLIPIPSSNETTSSIMGLCLGSSSKHLHEISSISN